MLEGWAEKAEERLTDLAATTEEQKKLGEENATKIDMNSAKIDTLFKLLNKAGIGGAAEVDAEVDAGV